MLHKTQGIVLRTVRYGETSVIVNIFTELFGIQSYLVNGVRTDKAKNSKANLLQPANILDLVVYHHDNKNLQRLSDFRFAYLYHALYGDVIKSSIALFLIELLDKTLKQPESYPELFHFAVDSLKWVDIQKGDVANLPLYFSLHVAGLQGFRIYGKYSPENPYLDLQEGVFISEHSSNTYCLDERCSRITGQLLEVKSIDLLKEIKTDKQIRQQLLEGYQRYFQLHLPGFSGLKSPRILSEILG
ncbi:MAG: DNA repair protein RecO [Chitinophagaceae bacterium]